MANSNSTNAWLKDWDALGKQFWSAWTENARAGAGGQTIPMHPGFDLWAQLFSGNTGDHGELVERMLGSGRQFAALMQSAVANLGGDKSGKPQEVIEAWRKATHEALGGMSATRNPVADAMRQAVGEGSKGFEQLFGNFVRAAAPFKSELMSGLSQPAFGYGRDRQLQMQKFGLASVEYSEALNAYNAQMLKASQRGLERMESKLAERSEPGRELSSLRGLYDLWIDAMEEGYAEVALSPEFRRVYGELVNAQMRVRQLVQQQVESAAAAVGLPTRAELDGVHRKMAELRRRLAALEESQPQPSAPRAEAGVPKKAPSAPREPAKTKPAAKRAPAKAPRFVEQLAASRARPPRKTRRK